MKKLFMVAPYFLPRRRVGALRPFKFAIHLRECGWEPHILTIASPGELTDKEKELLSDIHIYELKPPFDRTHHSGSQLNSSSGKKKEKPSATSRWIDKHFPVDTWLPFFMLKSREIKRIVRQVAPDAIWSTGDPWSAHWVGKKIAHDYEDLFWMADFRDPWTLSKTNLRQRSGFASSVDRKAERNIIRRASMLSFTSESTRRLYDQAYGELKPKTVTIYNSFDKELFNPMGGANDLKMDKNYLNLIFFGRFRRLSPAKPVIDILSSLKKKNAAAAERIRIHSFGPISQSDRAYACEQGVERCFVEQQSVPVERGLEVLGQADVLLLSTNPERRHIIPAKLWDYLAADRPILSIAPNEEIQTILEKTGAGVQYETQKGEEVAGLLEKCLKAKKEGTSLPIETPRKHQIIKQYSARAATAKLVQILDQHTV